MYVKAQLFINYILHSVHMFVFNVFLVQTWAAWLGRHNVEISGFICHSDLTWNQCWSFWSHKNCHFDHLSSSEVYIFGNFWLFQVWNSKNQSSKPSKLLKWQILTFWNQPEFISLLLKNPCGWKIANFPHCVWYSQKSHLGCPGLYMFVLNLFLVQISKKY